MFVDLHLHSNASDGVHAPGEVVRIAKERSMSLIALTDHDSVDGIGEASRAALAEGLALIPGVELSCEGEREIHLLGYGLDAEAPRWQAFFSELQQERRERALRMLALLAEQGRVLDAEQVLAMAKHSVSRAHIAQALVASGAASSVKEAFARYLAPGRPAYLPRQALPLPEALRVLRAGGAVPVLAHPGLLPMTPETLEANIRGWREQGLEGVEVYYPHHTPSLTQRLDKLARSLGMLVTGGSDMHGASVRPTRIGEGLEGWRSRKSDAEALWRRAGTTVGEWTT